MHPRSMFLMNEGMLMLTALRVGAVEASLSFLHCHFAGYALVNFFVAGNAVVGRKFGHFHPWYGSALLGRKAASEFFAPLLVSRGGWCSQVIHVFISFQKNIFGFQ